MKARAGNFCGCTIGWGYNRDEGNHPTIEYCARHKAAPQMLEALRMVRMTGYDEFADLAIRDAIAAAEAK